MKKSKIIELDTSSGIRFLWRGYFKAPDEEWVHISREIDSYEIFYVTKGQLFIADDEEEYTVNRGEYLITPPCRNQHGWKASRCEFYYVHFYAEEEISQGEGNHQGEGNPREEENPRREENPQREGNPRGEENPRREEIPSWGIYGDIDTLEKYYNLLSYDKRRQEACNHIVAAILLELKNGGSEEGRDNIAMVCHSIQSYIEFAPTGQLSIPLLADKFQYNQKYLSQSFKKETGIALKQCLKDEIMKRAKHMLLYTPLTIAEIAEKAGYSDSHSFSHVFKNMVGVSPREYRKSSAG